MHNARDTARLPLTGQKALALILIIGFLIRVIICFFTRLPNVHFDTHVYVQQADTLLAGGYTNFFPNGYPAIIAIAKTLAGSHFETLLLWLNIAFSTLTIWFAYDIGNRVFPKTAVGLIAAAIMAVFPSQINFVRWLMSEVPTSFFLLGAYFFYYRKKYFTSGIFFALSIFVRTNIALIPLCMVVIWLIRYRKIPWQMLAGIFIPLLIIASYCYRKTGEFSVSGNNQINILYAVTAKGDHVEFNLNEKHPEINTSGKAVKMYLDHLKADPLEYLSQKCANYWELWGFWPASAKGTRGTGSRILMGAGNFFMVVFGLIGWWRHRHSLDSNLLILPFITITFIHTLLFALTRHTYPVEAFMIILAASAFTRSTSSSY